MSKSLFVSIMSISLLLACMPNAFAADSAAGGSAAPGLACSSFSYSPSEPRPKDVTGVGYGANATAAENNAVNNCNENKANMTSLMTKKLDSWEKSCLHQKDKHGKPRCAVTRTGPNHEGPEECKASAATKNPVSLGPFDKYVATAKDGTLDCELTCSDAAKEKKVDPPKRK